TQNSLQLPPVRGQTTQIVGERAQLTISYSNESMTRRSVRGRLPAAVNQSDARHSERAGNYLPFLLRSIAQPAGSRTFDDNLAAARSLTQSLQIPCLSTVLGIMNKRRPQSRSVTLCLWPPTPPVPQRFLANLCPFPLLRLFCRTA
ncbi:hypothetical protein BC629DRAFT_1463426, partial [Irpex lacteus]